MILQRKRYRSRGGSVIGRRLIWGFQKAETEETRARSLRARVVGWPRQGGYWLLLVGAFVPFIWVLMLVGCCAWPLKQLIGMKLVVVTML